MFLSLKDEPVIINPINKEIKLLIEYNNLNKETDELLGLYCDKLDIIKANETFLDYLNKMIDINNRHKSILTKTQLCESNLHCLLQLDIVNMKHYLTKQKII